MKTSKYIWALIAASLAFLAGCASSKLELRVALYNDEPNVGAQIEKATISRALAGLGEARKLHEAAVMQSALADESYQVYRDAFLLSTRAANPASFDASKTEQQLGSLREQLVTWQAQLRPLASLELRSAIDAAEESVLVLDAARIVLEAAPNDANAIASLVGQRSDTFAKLSGVLRLIESGANLPRLSDYVETMNANMPAMRFYVQGPELRAAEYQSQADGLAARLSKNVAQLEQTALGNDKTATGQNLAQRAQDVFAVAVAEMKANEPKTISTKSVSLLTNARLFQLMNEFERLQDASDPRWRIVRDERNEHHWTNYEPQVYFYAQGKGGVTVVRDRPDDFRVQHASNDPTTMIRSQLQITRALGDAALAVAGAATGSPKLSLMRKGDTPGAVDDDGRNDAEQLAADRARLEEEARRRRLVLANLDLRLRTLRDTLRDAPEDQTGTPVINNASAELTAVLRSTKLILNPAPLPAGPQAGTTANAAPVPPAPAPPIPSAGGTMTPTTPDNQLPSATTSPAPGTTPSTTPATPTTTSSAPVTVEPPPATVPTPAVPPKG